MMRVLPLIAILVQLPRCGAAPLGAAEEVARAEVVGVRLSFEAPGQGQLGFDLQIHNPDRTPLDVREVEWELSLDGRRFATGLQALSASVPGRQAATVSRTFPLVFPPRPVRPGSHEVRVAVRGRV